MAYHCATSGMAAVETAGNTSQVACIALLCNSQARFGLILHSAFHVSFLLSISRQFRAGHRLLAEWGTCARSVQLLKSSHWPTEVFLSHVTRSHAGLR